jgi:hypothetical protein
VPYAVDLKWSTAVHPGCPAHSGTGDHSGDHSYLDSKGMVLPTVSLAANVDFMLPLVILFFLGQKYIMKGVVTSGLKG